MSMMKKLLEAMTKFAGEPEQKPGEQWKGTDKGTPGKKLVGDSIIKDLSKGVTPKTKEQELAEEWAKFNEDDIGVEPKRPGRKSDRPHREYTKHGKPSKRYTTVEDTELNEYKKDADNFTADDIKELEGIKDLATVKARAFALISKPSARPMKPEKVAWFKNRLDSLVSPIAVIKLMYDLLLSGEGQRVIGSRSSMGANSYRSRFNEGWNTFSDRVSLPDSPHTYWSGTGALQKEYDALYEKLVPAQGAAETIEGEVLRAASKIVYRHYNDGDEFNRASYRQLEQYIGPVTSYDDLAHKATEFALKANGNYHPNQGWDSLDVMDYGPAEEEDDDYDDEEEYGWEEEDDELEEADMFKAGQRAIKNIKSTEQQRKSEAGKMAIAQAQIDADRENERDRFSQEELYPSDDSHDLDEDDVSKLVNYTLGNTPDPEYIYSIFRDGKKEGTYHSLEQAKRIVANMKKTKGIPVDYKIKRSQRNKLAGPKGALPEANLSANEGMEEFAKSQAKQRAEKRKSIPWPKEVPTDAEQERDRTRAEEENDPHPYADTPDLDEGAADVYSITSERNGRERSKSGTLAELIEYYGYTLETGKSYEHERGNRKINLNPKSIESLVQNLNNAKSNAAANGQSNERFYVDNGNMAEGKHFKTAYGWAGGRNEKTGKMYKHPDQIKADREAKKMAIAQAQIDADRENERDRFSQEELYPSDDSHDVDEGWEADLAKSNRERMKKERDAAKLQAKMSQPIKAKPNYDRVMFDIETAIGDSFPDGDPMDTLMRKYRDSYGDLNIDLLNKACRVNGKKSYHDYVAKVWQQYMQDNPDLVQGGNPWVAEGEVSTRKYEMMLRNGQVKKFVAKDDADAKRIAAGHGAKSVIRMKGNVPGNKIAENDHPQHYVDRYNKDLERKIDKDFDPDYDRSMSDQEFEAKLKQRGKERNKGVAEGWESGPEERTTRERDPDAEYDARRQEKLDAEADAAQAKRPQTKVYTLSGRGPNNEPNYAFPGEYATQDEADKARAKLMANPKTPNPRDIGIRSHTKYMAEGIESNDPVEGAVLAAVQELIQQGHTEVAPEVITNMVVAATSQPFLLKDLVDANNNSPAIQHYVDSINPTKVKFSNEILTVKNEDPLKDKKQAQAGVSSMAARAASRNRLGETKSISELSTDLVTKVGTARAQQLAPHVASNSTSPDRLKFAIKKNKAVDNLLAKSRAANEKGDTASAQQAVAGVLKIRDTVDGISEGSETPLRDTEDYQAKRSALQQIQMDPDTHKDPQLKDELARRLGSLNQQYSDLQHKLREFKESRGHKVIATKLGNMDRMNTVQIPTPAERQEQIRSRKEKAAVKKPVKEFAVPGATTVATATPGAKPADPAAVAKAAAATNTLKAATGTTVAPATLDKALDSATLGTATSTDVKALAPIMGVLNKAAADPKLASQFKAIANQAKLTP